MTHRFSVLVFALLCLTACQPASENNTTTQQREEAPTPVILQPVVMQAEQVKLQAVGTSKALKSITLQPATAGEVVQVLFTAGQKVAQGQTLLQLDQRAEKLAVELATVRLNDAERLYQRYMRAQGSNTFAPTVIDEARTAVELRRIELQQANVALADRTVKAPFTGHIGITAVDPGDRIQTDTVIATLDDRSTLIVHFQIPEALADRIQLEQTVQVSQWQQRDGWMQGTIVDIDTQIDPVTRTFLAHAYVANHNDRLRPGMSFRVQLNFSGADYPTVPEVSVQWGGDGAYVWAVQQGTVQPVSVNIVQRLAGHILVDAELTPAMQVVLEGVQRMRAGLTVTEFQPTQLKPDE